MFFSFKEARTWRTKAYYTVSLQFMDKLIKHPKGIIEDMLVKVNKFHCTRHGGGWRDTFDLGETFFATRRALIDVQQGKIMMRVEDEEVTFDVYKAVDFPFEIHSCVQMGDPDLGVAKPFRAKTSKLPLEVCHVHDLEHDAVHTITP